jgi:hypothetical protein
VVRFGNQFIDERRGRLATVQVGLHGRRRDLCEHECGATQLCRAGAAKRVPRKVRKQDSKRSA